jgi:hypothetical protein
VVEQTFDLAGCSRQRYASTRGIRIELAVISIALAAIGVGGLVYQLAHGTFTSNFRYLYGLPYFVAFGLAILLGWGSTRFAPGATRMIVGEDGISFIFSGRGDQSLRWSDEHFRLDLEDTRSSPMAQKYGIAGYARIPNRPSSRLTPEALETLMAHAREHHLAVRVRERGGRWSLAGPKHTWVEIRPPRFRPSSGR